MKIIWNRVTWYSQLIAIVLFVGVFALEMWLGMRMAMPQLQHHPEQMQDMGTASHHTEDQATSTITYRCNSGKEIQAQFGGGRALLSFSDTKPDTYTNCAQIAAPISP